MNLSPDTRALIALWMINLALIICIVFRARKCTAILLPVPIAGLFLALPPRWWWLPGIGAVVWLMLLGTLRLRAIAVRKPLPSILLYVVCPLIVRRREECSADQLSFYEWRQGRAPVKSLRFAGDPAEYRANWLFYRKVLKGKLGTGSRFVYEKCYCPLGVRWIKNIRVVD